MKTLYITRSNNILIDTENNTSDKIETARQGIDTVYIAKEPMHVVYGHGEYKREFDVDANDIIITFYPKEFKHQAIVVKHAEWAENILEYAKEMQAEKERWAEANSQLTSQKVD